MGEGAIQRRYKGAGKGQSRSRLRSIAHVHNATHFCTHTLLAFRPKIGSLACSFSERLRLPRLYSITAATVAPTAHTPSAAMMPTSVLPPTAAASPEDPCGSDTTGSTNNDDDGGGGGGCENDLTETDSGGALLLSAPIGEGGPAVAAMLLGLGGGGGDGDSTCAMYVIRPRV